jgi:hypothetical protein
MSCVLFVKLSGLLFLSIISSHAMTVFRFVQFSSFDIPLIKNDNGQCADTGLRYAIWMGICIYVNFVVVIKVVNIYLCKMDDD